MQQHHDDHAPTIARNARYGLILFAVYVVFYGGFVLLSALRPDVMASRPFGGVNLAILYGFGLIIAALILALIYMTLCRTRSPSDGG
jgi:uncharacterized membrane protein (DUF485 family)